MNVRRAVIWGLGVISAAACNDTEHRLGSRNTGAVEAGAGGDQALVGAAGAGGDQALVGAAGAGGDRIADGEAGGAGGETTGGTSPSGGSSSAVNGGAGTGEAGSSPAAAGAPEGTGGESSSVIGWRTTVSGDRPMLVSDPEGLAMAWQTPTSIRAAMMEEQQVGFDQSYVIAETDTLDSLRLVGLAREKTEAVYVVHLERNDSTDAPKRFRLQASYHDTLGPAILGTFQAFEIAELGEGESELAWPEVVFALTGAQRGMAAWIDAADGGCRLMSASFVAAALVPPQLVADWGAVCGAKLAMSGDGNGGVILAWEMPEAAESPGLFSATWTPGDVSYPDVPWSEPMQVDPRTGALLVAGGRGSLWASWSDGTRRSTRSYTPNDGWSEDAAIPGAITSTSIVLGSDGNEGAYAYWVELSDEDECWTRTSRFRPGVGWSVPEDYSNTEWVTTLDANEDGAVVLMGYTAHATPGECVNLGPLFAKRPGEPSGRLIGIDGSQPPVLEVTDEGNAFFGQVHTTDDGTVVTFGSLQE